MARLSTLAIAAGLLGGAAILPAPANAALYKFFSGTTGYTGPYSGAGTVYDALKNQSITCPTANPGCGSADITGHSLTFADFTATANGTNVIVVNEDLQPSFGGMGIEGGTDTDDQIDPGNIVTLTFTAHNVVLTGVATLFTSGHLPFDPFTTVPTVADLVGRGALINNQFFSFASLNAGGLSIAGSGGNGNVFTFAAPSLSSQRADYYISGLNVVPLPGAALLFGTALAGLGWMRRRGSGAQSEATAA